MRRLPARGREGGFVSAALPPLDPADEAEGKLLADGTVSLFDYYAEGAMRALVPGAVRSGRGNTDIAEDSFALALAMVRVRRRYLARIP
jgi:hypothetical protein